jgi:hypothetical protein
MTKEKETKEEHIAYLEHLIVRLLKENREMKAEYEKKIQALQGEVSGLLERKSQLYEELKFSMGLREWDSGKGMGPR